MCTIRALCVLAFTTAVTAPSFAGEIRGTIGEVWASPSSQHVMFTVNGTDADPARCNTSARYSINLAQPGGRVTFDTLLAALENDFSVRVIGLKTCNGYDAENIKYLVLE